MIDIFAKKKNPENCLLGIIMNYPEHFEALKKTGNIFQDRICKELYDILEKENTFNKQTILDLLQKRTISEDEFNNIYLSEFQESQFKIYHEYVLTKFVRRTLMTEASNIYHKEIKSIDEIKKELNDLLLKIDLAITIKNITAEEVIKEIMNSNFQVKTFESGIEYIDQFGGYEVTDFIVLAARPSVGKTSLALNLIRKHLLNNKKVGFFSLEVNPPKIIQKLVCLHTEVEEWKCRKGILNSVEKENLIKGFNFYYNKNLIFGKCYNIMDIVRQIEKMKKENNIDIVYIDYLQFISGDFRKNKYEVTSEISKQLKTVARELETPVFCLAQLNRETEKRGGRPRMSDLRDSGTIEQDADMIIMLSEKEKVEQYKSILYCDFIKMRNMPVGEKEIAFDKNKGQMIFLENNS